MDVGKDGDCFRVGAQDTFGKSNNAETLDWKREPDLEYEAYKSGGNHQRYFPSGVSN